MQYDRYFFLAREGRMASGVVRDEDWFRRCAFEPLGERCPLPGDASRWVDLFFSVHRRASGRREEETTDLIP
jgi:hypothetical protein